MKNSKEYKTEIERKKKELIQLLKAYSRSQVKLWQQVPALAQKFDHYRLDIYSPDQLRIAYLSNTWIIFPSEAGLRVNLQTGELGSNERFGHVFGQITLAKLPIIAELLDAEKIIRVLKEQIEKCSVTNKNLKK